MRQGKGGRLKLQVLSSGLAHPLVQTTATTGHSLRCPSIISALNEWPGAQIATITCYVFASVLTFPPICLMTVAGEGEPRKEDSESIDIYGPRAVNLPFACTFLPAFSGSRLDNSAI